MLSPLAQQFTEKVLPLLPEGYRAEIRQMPPHERNRVKELGLGMLEEGETDYAYIVECIAFELSDISFEKAVQKWGDPATVGLIQR